MRLTIRLGRDGEWAASSENLDSHGPFDCGAFCACSAFVRASMRAIARSPSLLRIASKRRTSESFLRFAEPDEQRIIGPRTRQAGSGELHGPGKGTL